MNIDHGPFTHLRSKNLSRRNITPEEKKWLGEQVNSKIATISDLTKRYSLHERSLRRYAQKVRDGLKFYDSNNGRPPLVDDEQIKAMKIALMSGGEKGKKKNKKKNCVTDDKFVKIVQKCISDTRINAGKSPAAPRVSQRTLKRLRKQIGANIPIFDIY